MVKNPELKIYPKLDKKMDKQQSNFYKLTAASFMLGDHVASLFLTGTLYVVFRLLGRLVYPIFAYQLSVSYQKTSNLKKYFSRLLVLAVISQLPYTIFRNQSQASFKLNIIFTLLAVLTLIYLVDNRKFLLAIFISILGIILPLEYNIYGLLLPLTFYLFNKPSNLIFSQLLLITGVLFITESQFYVLQLFSLLAIPLIKLKIPIKIPLNKYFFYVFYPGHLGILSILYFLAKVR